MSESNGKRGRPRKAREKGTGFKSRINWALVDWSNKNGLSNKRVSEIIGIDVSTYAKRIAEDDSWQDTWAEELEKLVQHSIKNNLKPLDIGYIFTGKHDIDPLEEIRQFFNAEYESFQLWERFLSWRKAS